MKTLQRGQSYLTSFQAVPFITILLLSGVAFCQTPRMELPSPVLMIYGYTDHTTGKLAYYTSFSDYKAEWQKALQVFNTIDGETTDAELVKHLRTEGKIFAYHVVNVKNKTAEQLADDWSAPFRNDLGGALPGGFDAICIDEFHSFPDGTPGSRVQSNALELVRQRYPDRLIIVSAVWKLADGGPSSTHGNKGVTFDQTLKAIDSNADLLVLENYQQTSNPQLSLFDSLARNLQSRVPGILKKAIFALLISQSAPFIADNAPGVDLSNFLSEQMHVIRSHSPENLMPGVAFWVFYRSKPATIDAAGRAAQRTFRR